MSIRVCEMFKSIQGESSYAGLPCSFVRLTGCNLACRYCDTTYAREEGQAMEVSEIMEKIQSYSLRFVEITGGEPLIQSDTPILADILLKNGYIVLLETNGSLDISVLPDGVIRIIDLKCPSSGEVDRNRWENLKVLKPYDEIKFVIEDRSDYEWARDVICTNLRGLPNTILLSPVYNELPPATLAQWLLLDHLDARLQLPLHKYIWPGQTRGV